MLQVMERSLVKKLLPCHVTGLLIWETILSNLKRSTITKKRSATSCSTFWIHRLLMNVQTPMVLYSRKKTTVEMNNLAMISQYPADVAALAWVQMKTQKIVTTKKKNLFRKVLVKRRWGKTWIYKVQDMIKATDPSSSLTSKDILNATNINLNVHVIIQLVRNKKLK